MLSSIRQFGPNRLQNWDERASYLYLPSSREVLKVGIQ